MASVCKEMPRHYKLKRRIKELNSLWNITPAPNGILGVQQSLEDSLFIRVSHLLKTASEDAAFKMGLSQSNFLEMGPGLVRDYMSLTSHSLSQMKAQQLIQVREIIYSQQLKFLRNEDLKLALEDIRRDVERLDKMKVDTETFQIEYFLGGDLKFLAIILGIDCVTSMLAHGVHVAWMNVVTYRKSGPLVTLLLEQEQWQETHHSQLYQNRKRSLMCLTPHCFQQFHLSMLLLTISIFF